MNDGKKTAVRESKFNFDGTESEVVENKVPYLIFVTDPTDISV